VRSGGRGWAAAIFAAVALGGADANAQARALAHVNATVSSICRISAGDLAFGAYDPLGVHEASPLDAEVRILVSCTRAISGTLTLQTAHGDPSAAFLVSGSDQLGYALYKDAGRTTFWSDYVSGKPNRRSFEVPVFGRIEAGQDVADGDYADSVTVRLDF
jgi:spore coat protein U-like protein